MITVSTIYHNNMCRIHRRFIYKDHTSTHAEGADPGRGGIGGGGYLGYIWGLGGGGDDAPLWPSHAPLLFDSFFSASEQAAATAHLQTFCALARAAESEELSV